LRIFVAKSVHTWGFSSFATREDLERFKRGDYWYVRHYPFFDFDTQKLEKVWDFVQIWKDVWNIDYAVLKTSNGYHLIILDTFYWRTIMEMMLEAIDYGLDTMFFRICALRGFAVLRYGSKGRKPKPKLITYTNQDMWGYFLRSRAKFLVMYETTNW